MRTHATQLISLRLSVPPQKYLLCLFLYFIHLSISFAHFSWQQNSWGESSKRQIEEAVHGHHHPLRSTSVKVNYKIFSDCKGVKSSGKSVEVTRQVIMFMASVWWSPHPSHQSPARNIKEGECLERWGLHKHLSLVLIRRENLNYSALLKWVGIRFCVVELQCSYVWDEVCYIKLRVLSSPAPALLPRLWREVCSGSYEEKLL